MSRRPRLTLRHGFNLYQIPGSKGYLLIGGWCTCTPRTDNDGIVDH